VSSFEVPDMILTLHYCPISVPILPI